MPETINLYMDESGTRRPDKKQGRGPAHKYDFFGMGGVLIKQSDEQIARNAHRLFCEKWNIKYPLHSQEIRAKDQNYAWLALQHPDKQNSFYDDLTNLIVNIPFIGIACVIDRPGYNARYKERYGHRSWLLCKTAFNIVVERAAKYASELELPMRIYPEKCNKHEDKLLKEYYDKLKTEGQPFNPITSQKYKPMSHALFQKTLYEFKIKSKSSPMVQFADLVLWPICMGGYDKTNRSYRDLRKNGRLIECYIPEADWNNRATKYSCFP